MSCGIYKITNSITNESYIGQSIRIEARFQEHKTAQDNYAIHKAIRKYGVNNFIFEIIEECEKEKLFEREKYWISFYDSYYHGYNETLGGEGVLEANKKKINQYTLDGKYLRTFDSITEANQFLNKTYNGSGISSVCKGKRKMAFNYQWRYEEDFPNKENIEPIKAIDVTRKQIYQLDNNDNIINVYDNIALASKETKIGRTSISNCLNGYSNTAGGYKWKKSQ